MSNFSTEYWIRRGFCAEMEKQGWDWATSSLNPANWGWMKKTTGQLGEEAISAGIKKNLPLIVGGLGVTALIPSITSALGSYNTNQKMNAKFDEISKQLANLQNQMQTKNIKGVPQFFEKEKIMPTA